MIFEIPVTVNTSVRMSRHVWAYGKAPTKANSFYLFGHKFTCLKFGAGRLVARHASVSLVDRSRLHALIGWYGIHNS